MKLDIADLFYVRKAVLTLIVLGLSAGIYRGINSDSDVSRPIRQMGGLQAAIGFCAFAATWGLVNVFIRMVTTPTQVVGLVSEALATLFFFAGAVVSIPQHRSEDCNDKSSYLRSGLRSCPQTLLAQKRTDIALSFGRTTLFCSFVSLLTRLPWDSVAC